MQKQLYLCVICLLGWFYVARAQETDTLSTNSYSFETLPIQLEEIEVYSFDGPRRFATEAERKEYYILRYRVKKVYKYARLAAERLRIMEETMDTMQNQRHKKIYVERMQRYIENRFTDELKNLSRSQGRILVKLIYRQTGRNAYDLVKELRSGWNAFWYNTTAWLYNISLKSEYKPEQVREDYLIEDILRRSFFNGELDYQKSAIPIDYLKLRAQWDSSTYKNNLIM